jgi:hypothetical protein
VAQVDGNVSVTIPTRNAARWSGDESVRRLDPRRGWWVCGAALALLLAVTLSSLEPMSDVGWLMYLAREVLDGKQLYVDVIDVNPPLIVVLSAVVLRAAAVLGAPPLTMFALASALLLIACAWWTASLLRRYSAAFEDRLRTAAVITIVLALLPRYDFGQREHLLAALTLPYLVLSALRLRGLPVGAGEGLAIGALAGLGFALKPHQLLAFLLIELLVIYCRRRLVRTESIGVLVVVSAYLAGIATLFPAYLANTVPLAVAYYMIESDNSLGAMLIGRPFIALGTLGLVLAIASRWRVRHDPLLLVLVVFGLGAGLAYFSQSKGWHYQALPCLFALTFALLHSLFVVEIPERSRRATQALYAMVVVVGSLYMANRAFFIWAPQRTAMHQLATVLGRGAAPSVLLLSDDMQPAWPVVFEAGVQWASRFDSMWALIGETRRVRRIAPQPMLREVRNWMVDDFLAGMPQLVLVDKASSMDYLGELLSDERFARAWSHYDEVAQALPGWRTYTIRRAGAEVIELGATTNATGRTVP